MVKRNGRNKEERIKVMWLSINASLFRVEKTSRGWTSSLETALKKYHGDGIELAVVYEGDINDWGERRPVKTTYKGSIYYKISNRMKAPAKALHKADVYDMWEYIRPEILEAIGDFKPDIIQCFGSEWPYGMIAEDVDIPVVIHMQGFIGVYDLSGRLLPRVDSPRRIITSKIPENIKRKIRQKNTWPELEKHIMQTNRYFMGRTRWDRNIVKYYSPGARYYNIPEAIRPGFFDAYGTWKGNDALKKSRIILLTVTQASTLKGNGIILHTARILNKILGIDFEWRVAGNPELFIEDERTTGIKHTDVNIVLLGWITQDQIITELQNAAFFIHPSIIDNSPNAICEAQLIGIPVIASYVGGVPDLVEDGVTGFLYPYNEPHTLAFKIAELRNQRELLAEIAENESRVARRRHDPEMIAHEVYNTYQRIIDDYR